jgi:hypothetical protein
MTDNKAEALMLNVQNAIDRLKECTKAIVTHWQTDVDEADMAIHNLIGKELSLKACLAQIEYSGIALKYAKYDLELARQRCRDIWITNLPDDDKAYDENHLKSLRDQAKNSWLFPEMRGENG